VHREPGDAQSARRLVGPQFIGEPGLEVARRGDAEEGVLVAPEEPIEALDRVFAFQIAADPLRMTSR